MAAGFDATSLSAKAQLEKYIINSNDILEMKLVRCSSDLNDDKASFKPDMSHQIYGDSEQIFGYMGLNIKLYYSACRLTTYLAHSYDEKVNPSEFEGIKPDDVIKPIAEKMPSGYLTNIDDFTRSLDKDQNFRPFGEMIQRFTVETESGEEKVFEIYYNDISPSGFVDFHERLQTFVLWYIDASSYIDTDDERWKFFILYEKYIENGHSYHAIAGYTTVYEYYAYPENIRPRISQMLVLPPFQRLGLGYEMLQTIYKRYQNNSKVMDITVEDPAENFQRLRDFLDCRNCLKLKDFSVDKKLTKEMISEVNKQLKLNKKQIIRIYEIIKLQTVDKENAEQYKNYRLLVKNRLYALYRKEDSDLKKLEKVLSADELRATLSITSREQRQETLEKLYKEIEEEYDHIVEKLDSADVSF